MGVIVPITYSQAVIRWGLTGDPSPMVCTLGVGPHPGHSPTDVAEEIYADLVMAGSVCAAAQMSTHYQLQGVTVYFQNTGGFEIGAYDDVLQGTGNSTPLPSNCAFLVRKNTTLGGRRNRGRFFVPPFMEVESNVTPTGAIAANFAAIQARWDVFYNALTSVTPLFALQPVLFHSDGGTPTPITGFSLQNTIATQRERMR